MGPRVLAPRPAGLQPRDAALPRSRSSTSSSSSTSSGCSPPSCGRPTPAGVTRGSSTGEPRPRARAPPSSGASNPGTMYKSKDGGPRMNLFQGKNPAPDSLAGPARQRSALARPLDALRHQKANRGHSVPGPAPELGSARAGQTQTSPQRAGSPRDRWAAGGLEEAQLS